MKTMMENSSKQREFMAKYRDVINNQSLPDSFLGAALSKSSSISIFMPAWVDYKLPYIMAATEYHKESNGGIAPEMLIEIINFICSDKKNTQNLTQDDYWILATIPCANKRYNKLEVFDVVKNQLLLIPFIEGKDLQKKAILNIYNNLLENVRSVEVEKQILKHWKKWGDVSEIEHLIPSVLGNKSTTSISSVDMILFEIDCNQLGWRLEKKSEQKEVINYAAEVVNAFMKKEEKSWNLVVFKNMDKLQNKISIYFKPGANVQKLQQLVNLCLNDIENVIKKPARDLHEYAVSCLSKMTLKDDLDEKLKDTKRTRKNKI